mmetsp:Transcript_14644/g.43988  ORF Transcript_14644/g.43988 Transcript_14644/m.43988 type:complete len:214 (-) Transcript_14644:319-960(-)
MSGAQGLHEHVLAAPMGFVSAIQLLERLCEAPKAVLHLARNVARYDEDNTGDMTAENYVEAFQAAGIAMNAAALGNASRALAYLYRGVKTTDTDAEAAAGVLGMSTSLSEDACYVVTQAIAKAMSEVAAGGEGEAAKPKKPLKIGQLSGTEWRLGVAIASRGCDQLLTPYVSINLKAIDDNGIETTIPVELSYAEFQEFKRELRAASAAMDMA